MQTDTYRIVVDDIMQTIKQTFDDKIIAKSQIAYWVTVVGNQLLGQHIDKRDSGQFLNVFARVPVQIDSANSGANRIKDRKYIELPSLIFDFDKDGGVEFIAYYNESIPGDYTRKIMYRTTQAQSQWLRDSPYTKPSPENCYWYRSGNERIYFDGIENVPVKNVEIGIYTTLDPLINIDLDSPFPFPSELLSVLKMQVLNLARYSFLFPTENRGNDGDDNTEKAQTVQKIASVNDPNIQQEKKQRSHKHVRLYSA